MSLSQSLSEEEETVVEDLSLHFFGSPRNSRKRGVE